MNIFRAGAERSIGGGGRAVEHLPEALHFLDEVAETGMCYEKVMMVHQGADFVEKRRETSQVVRWLDGWLFRA